MYIVGFIYASLVEWLVHKYLFHGVGKRKNNIFSFHIREHHVNCLKNENQDNNFTLRENVGVMFLAAIHAPILVWSVPFFLGVVSYGINFMIIHKICHMKVAWGKRFIPWHWDHHMKNPNKNFGVVAPWSDYLFGTRKDH